MARPIKETPILLGEDAKRFNDAIKENETKKTSPQEYKNLQDSFNKFKIVNA